MAEPKSMLWQLTAREAAERIRAGLITSEELVGACLERIASTDETIGAWAHLSADQALAQAREMDELHRRGLPQGALQGVPVGIKDIFDTADMPTAYGSPIHQGRRPALDSMVVSKLREAGAVIMGKTVTTEFAFSHPAGTTNPHDPARTPGGSSSGSAAAVASGHLPLALGSQTNGSTLRPASFCGIYGFKPTRGVLPRRGALRTSRTLDHVGLFARSLEDLCLLADALGGYDPEDPASYARPRPALLAGWQEEAPVEPALAWFDLPYGERLDEDAGAAFAELIDSLGGRVEKLPAPADFAKIIDCHGVIHEHEMSLHLKDEMERHWDRLSPSMQAALARGRGHSAARYEEALAMVAAAESYFAAFFKDYDAILTPAATGEARALEEGTGDPIFCTLGTFSGLPALSLPWLTGKTGLPIGVQLIGSAQGDDRLVRTARWVQNYLDAKIEDTNVEVGAGAPARDGRPS